MQDKYQEKKKTKGLAGSHRPPLCFADKDSQTSTDSKTCDKKNCTYCKTVFICKKKRRQENNIVMPYCIDHRLHFRGLVGTISRHPAPFGLSSDRVPEGTGRHTPSNGNQHYLGQSDLCKFSLKLFRTFPCFWPRFQRQVHTWCFDIRTGSHQDFPGTKK